MRLLLWKLISVVLLLGLALSACTPQPAAPQAAVQPAVTERVVTQQVEKVVTQQVEVTRVVAAPKEAQVVHMIGGMGGDFGTWYETLMKDYNTSHPENPVQFTNMQHEDLKQGIRAMLLSQPQPDLIFWGAGNRTRFFIDKGLVMDISDAWAKDIGTNVAGSFKALSTVNGKQYYIPSDYHWWSIWYKKDTFQKAGVTPPTNWNELLAACDTLNAKGIAPIAIGNRFKWPAAGWFDYIDMRLNGPQFHTQVTDLKVAYNDPKIQKVFEYWKQLFDHKCFIPDAAAYDWQEAVPFLIKGKAAMYLMGSFILEEIPKEQQGDFDFFQFPTIDPSVPVGEDAPTDGFIIPASAPNPEGAKALAAWLASKEVQQKRLDDNAKLPTRTDVDLSKLSAFAQKGIKLVQSASMVTMFYDRETTPDFVDKGMDAFLKFWDNPTTANAILNQLESDRQDYLKNNP